MIDTNKISAFLLKTRNQGSYEEKIQTKSANTQRNLKLVIRNFGRFCDEKYGKTVDEMTAEMPK